MVSLACYWLELNGFRLIARKVQQVGRPLSTYAVIELEEHAARRTLQLINLLIRCIQTQLQGVTLGGDSVEV